MKKRSWVIIGATLVLTLVAAGVPHGETVTDLCLQVDMKPVLSLQQINQAELVHYLVILSGNEPPSPEGLSVEEFYQKEIEILINAGYPPILAEVEPDRLVTRRYFASIMFQIAVLTDPTFAARYGNLTDETAQLQALIESEYLYSEEGNLYREEILSVLCTKDIGIEEPKPIDIVPEIIREGSLDAVLIPESPI